jgi:transcriptional regulator of acetoin/glycerol metabolism
VAGEKRPCGGTMSTIGIDRTTLYHKIKAYNIASSKNRSRV